MSPDWPQPITLPTRNLLLVSLQRSSAFRLQIPPETGALKKLKRGRSSLPVRNIGSSKQSRKNTNSKQSNCPSTATCAASFTLGERGKKIPPFVPAGDSASHFTSRALRKKQAAQHRAAKRSAANKASLAFHSTLHDGMQNGEMTTTSDATPSCCPVIELPSNSEFPSTRTSPLDLFVSFNGM